MIYTLLQCAVAFVATCAFAVLFHVPKEQYLFCGLTGGAGWGCYLLVLGMSGSEPLACFFAAFLLAVLSRVFAAWRCCPSTSFLLCGIFPLVPGAGIYYTAYYFIVSQNDLAAKHGTQTMKIAMAIALGIVMVLALPGNLFGVFAPRKRS